ncbi:tRNA1(Val) (adenine(37)-N6)-methyltransferase [Pseudobacteriovorax antillogorgiicola]|uniref:tRNA1Val (Adenine37-N6)-methyltransferase n=1 Tax=Pseudobacteriovorax antillogorgiicola TaxID=1513793 RepID=A0A1Y6C9H6_9BACT|nr:methyltransferase [Pseudobacteriovorax antillogorgiicola]TCS49032.1 tRNA1Val (adenine37-N6)-methyltransferase [Pseudobacteriovorax antillogorgiicola]SMF52741.1 tRNA1Val (adenine37-N6)-methyltransferase [Pseudobacteriovorax antillogorgiicola]
MAFRFQQFTVEQNRCGMRVCTDSNIFGAWIAPKLGARTALDIGTGTGLLSLMVCQRYSKLYIDGLEIDEEAASQAHVNSVSSPWGDRFRVNHGDINQWNDIPTLKQSYDVIFCNPPFFDRSLLSLDEKRRLARHEQSLTLYDLMEILDKRLECDGEGFLLLPATREDDLILASAGKNLFLNQLVKLRSRSNKEPHRIMVRLSREEGRFLKSCETILDENSDYTSWVQSLLQNYLLRYQKHV